MKVNTWRTAIALITAALVATVALSTAAASSKALTLTIWTDANRAPAVTKIANSWAAANGATIKVVTKDFGSIRSNLGAVQNRLESAVSNLGVTQENLSASESRIRDVDVAQEMVNFTRLQILSQSGTAMLAQANQAPQSVLSLLR